MIQPKFIKATGGNCGLYAITMAVNALLSGIDVSNSVRIAYNVGSTYFGELFTKEQVNTYLKGLEKQYDIEYEFGEFDTVETLADKLEFYLKQGKYCLLVYSALQGYVITPKNPKMTQSHWVCVYDIDRENGIVSGIQSNSKAEMLHLLKDVKLETLLESNNSINRVKVNFGKYHKCAICRPTKQLETQSRCAREYCLKNVDMPCSKCVYSSDLGGVLLAIGKRKGDADGNIK